MDSKKLLIRIVFLVLIIFLLNYLAMKFYWYYSIWYFDILMHFLGGIWLGFAFLYLFSIEKITFNLILKILFVTLLIGIGWEIFEILIDNFITGKYFNYLDTISDLLFDLAGSLFVVFYFLKRAMSNEKNIV